jgi:hypothetical protein
MSFMYRGFIDTRVLFNSLKTFNYCSEHISQIGKRKYNQKNMNELVMYMQIPTINYMKEMHIDLTGGGMINFSKFPLVREMSIKIPLKFLENFIRFTSDNMFFLRKIQIDIGAANVKSPIHFSDFSPQVREVEFYGTGIFNLSSPGITKIEIRGGIKDGSVINLDELPNLKYFSCSYMEKNVFIICSKPRYFDKFEISCEFMRSATFISDEQKENIYEFNKHTLECKQIFVDKYCPTGLGFGSGIPELIFGRNFYTKLDEEFFSQYPNTRALRFTESIPVLECFRPLITDITFHKNFISEFSKNFDSSLLPNLENLTLYDVDHNRIAKPLEKIVKKLDHKINLKIHNLDPLCFDETISDILEKYVDSFSLGVKNFEIEEKESENLLLLMRVLERYQIPSSMISLPVPGGNGLYKIISTLGKISDSNYIYFFSGIKLFLTRKPSSVIEVIDGKITKNSRNFHTEGLQNIVCKNSEVWPEYIATVFRNICFINCKLSCHFFDTSKIVNIEIHNTSFPKAICVFHLHENLESLKIINDRGYARPPSVFFPITKNLDLPKMKCFKLEKVVAVFSNKMDFEISCSVEMTLDKCHIVFATDEEEKSITECSKTTKYLTACLSKGITFLGKVFKSAEYKKAQK